MITINNLEQMAKSLYMTRYNLPFNWFKNFNELDVNSINAFNKYN